MSIKYYHLAKGEELPEEFCVVRDVNGEPEEYVWYKPMDSFDHELWNIFKESDWVVASEYRKLYRKLKAENDKLREVMSDGEESARIILDESRALQAENAKLREERDRYKVMFESVHATAGELHRVRYEWKRDREQNAKLRELVRDYERCTVHADCARCEYDGKMSTHCPFSPCFPDIDELNELGVEVD